MNKQKFLEKIITTDKWRLTMILVNEWQESLYLLLIVETTAFSHMDIISKWICVTEITQS